MTEEAGYAHKPYIAYPLLAIKMIKETNGHVIRGCADWALVCTFHPI